MDYIHLNPVKHGLVDDVSDWHCSTLHLAVENGIYPRDWDCSSLAKSVVELREK